ncbi:unnamed protein product, partial [Prorocentrum cordatum]
AQDSAAASSVERLTAEQRSRAVTVVYRRASSVRFAFQSLGPVEEGCSHALLLGEAGSATQTSERSPERRSGGAGRGARGPPGERGRGGTTRRRPKFTRGLAAGADCTRACARLSPPRGGSCAPPFATRCWRGERE